jgi:hypothetical protein
VVPRNQSRLIRDLPLSDRSASASFRSTGAAMLGDFLMEELYSFVGEGWEQEDDITLVTLRQYSCEPLNFREFRTAQVPRTSITRTWVNSHREGGLCGALQRFWHGRTAAS